MIDVVLLAVIGLSALLGLVRGFVGIVVGTVSWALAGWAAFRFGGEAGYWLAHGSQPSSAQSIGGYALVFVGVLVLVSVAGVLIRAGVNAVSLNGADRLLGFFLGLARGVLFGCLLVLLAGFTPLADTPAWRQSRLLPLLLPGADWMRARLPNAAVAQAELGKLPIAGDNTRLDLPLSVSALQDTMARMSDRVPAGEDGRQGDPVQTSPQNIDPAEVRSADADPTRVESPGQVRPYSQ